jgi:hypothetical protein
LNAPRQGLFASLLIISFALHVMLIIQATTHQLDNTRTIQGELMTRQLAEDSLVNLTPIDTVSLALLSNRFAARPDVASLKIMSADGKVLTTSGAAPTRSGEIFRKKIMLDQRVVGQVELVLIEPSIGELIRLQWLSLLLSLLIHGFLWLLYRVIARPTRREYLDSLARERQLHEQLLAVKHHADTLQKNVILAQATIPAKATTDSKSDDGAAAKPAIVEPDFVLHIGFSDPKQLLGTLSPGLARPYFNLCQTLLEQAIEHIKQQFAQDQIQIKILQGFGERGALVSAQVSPQGDTAQGALFLAKLSNLFNLLTDVVYRRHRDIKRFALHTRAAIAQQQPNQPAQAVAQRLLEHVNSNQVAVHLADDQVLHVQQHFQLSPLANPMDAITREALLVIAMNVEFAQFAEQARKHILSGDKDKKSASESE